MHSVSSPEKDQIYTVEHFPYSLDFYFFLRLLNIYILGTPCVIFINLSIFVDGGIFLWRSVQDTFFLQK